MIESPKNFIEQFQNFIEHIAGLMKTFLTKEVADTYYLSITEQILTEVQQTQSLRNQGVIQAIEELTEENGGTVPTSLSETNTISLQSASDPWEGLN